MRYDPSLWSSFSKGAKLLISDTVELRLSEPGTVFYRPDAGAKKVIFYGTELKLQLPSGDHEIEVSVSGSVNVPIAIPQAPRGVSHTNPDVRNNGNSMEKVLLELNKLRRGQRDEAKARRKMHDDMERQRAAEGARPAVPDPEPEPIDPADVVTPPGEPTTAD